MISEEWLNKGDNSKIYDVPSRIIANGRAWGDDKDPEEIEERAARVKEEKKALKKKTVILKITKKAGQAKGKAKGKGKAKAEPEEAYDSDDMYVN